MLFWVKASLVILLIDWFPTQSGAMGPIGISPADTSGMYLLSLIHI